jgi:hypothetical protein
MSALKGYVNNEIKHGKMEPSGLYKNDRYNFERPPSTVSKMALSDAEKPKFNFQKEAQALRPPP